MKLILIWEEGTFRQFEEAISFIERDSSKSAEKFKIEIFKKIRSTSIIS